MSIKDRLLISAGAISGLYMGLLSFPEAIAASCSKIPTCAELGFTQTEAECATAEGMLRCPFETTAVYCSGVSSSFVHTTPVVGDIVYSDKTLSSIVEKGKYPVAVVVDPGKRVAVALAEIDENGKPSLGYAMKWTTEVYDVKGLENCGSSTDEYKKCATDGEANTKAIMERVKEAGTGKYPAAEAAYKYQPEGCVAGSWCGAGKWFLPSAANYLPYSYNISVIENRMAALLGKGAISYKDSQAEHAYGHWVSMEHDAWDGQYLSIFTPEGGNSYGWRNISKAKMVSSSNGIEMVRPFIKF